MLSRTPSRNFRGAVCRTFITKVVDEVHFRSPTSKVAAFQYESSTKSKLPQPGLNVATFQYESSTRTKLQQPRKSKLFNTKVVHKVNFRSPFQFQSSTRSELPQLQAHKLLANYTREDPLASCLLTFAKLSRILLQTFAKIRLKVALNLTRKLQNSHKWCLLAGGCFCSSVFCGDTQAAHSPTNFSLQAFCPCTAGKYT